MDPSPDPYRRARPEPEPEPEPPFQRPAVPFWPDPERRDRPPDPDRLDGPERRTDLFGPGGPGGREDAWGGLAAPVGHGRHDHHGGHGRRRFGLGLVLLCLLAGVLGGYVGSRFGRGPAAEPVVLRPVVQEVVASGKAQGDQIQAVASGLLPVTVQIRTGDGARGGTGSGVIMRPDGFILTNNHVVAGTDTITVVLPSSEALEARLIGADPDNDLAVVKIDRNDLPVANFGKSAEVKVGELAVAVGSPFGLRGSVTAGIVSALHRVVEIGDDERLVNAIQTDASINPGNSGGALANGRGQVIGINTAIATGGADDANAGVGFAIPIDEALEVAGELIAGREVRTPLLGVEGGIDLTPEVAERYGVKGRTGALVTRAVEDGPAARAGMRAGDLVVRIGDDQIRGWDELVVAVRKAEIGQAVPVVVVRDGRELTLQVTPTEQP